jgi:hypothetical protein
VRLSFYLDLHRLVQSHDLHHGHKGPVTLASLFQIVNDWRRYLIDRYGNIDARLVDLVPTPPASLTDGMFDVVEGLVNLFGKVVGVLFCRAIPTA